MKKQATSSDAVVPRAEAAPGDVGTGSSSDFTPLSLEKSVYESLVAYGAPLLEWAPRCWLRLEETLPWALKLAHDNATVLRVLPLVLARYATALNGQLLQEQAHAAGQEAELGFLLELTAQLTARDELAHLARCFEDARPQEPRYFFEPRSARDRRLAELKTPAVARRWGLFLNMPEDSFSSLLAKHDPALLS
ncbi:MAG TPA: hypothetical protein VFZ09_20130 [Archangium sp.]|uniref:hypothetical protein n=1 Tax=Archangium sp. TaxID=1872627 RepID=UPI002E30A30C|nr:hypothetical protein [Archangium sp.]HEX5748559.1 hypothetical protein [Archangium sp.]